MDVLKNCMITPEDLAELRAERDALDDQAQRMSWFLKSVNEGSIEMDEEGKEKIIQRINELNELCTSKQHRKAVLPRPILLLSCLLSCCVFIDTTRRGQRES